jgi:hypothetical protein
MSQKKNSCCGSLKKKKKKTYYVMLFLQFKREFNFKKKICNIISAGIKTDTKTKGTE